MPKYNKKCKQSDEEIWEEFINQLIERNIATIEQICQIAQDITGIPVHHIDY
ncbi:MAG: hypothetical protein OXI87_18930 [Albidovulum sp.]|nr:hypothetical protein [Albidovulum sp.]